MIGDQGIRYLYRYKAITDLALYYTKISFNCIKEIIIKDFPKLKHLTLSIFLNYLGN